MINPTYALYIDGIHSQVMTELMNYLSVLNHCVAANVQISACFSLLIFNCDIHLLETSLSSVPSKKLKLDSENCHFNEEWTSKYAFAQDFKVHQFSH